MTFYHVSLNGKIMPASDARISLLNPALLSGFGVYESVEVISSVPFHLGEHLARLAESARIIELDLPYGRDEMADWIARLIQWIEGDMTLRVVALGASDTDDRALVAVLPQLILRYPEAHYRQGVRLVSYEGCRPVPACKSLNTLVNLLARRHATRAGAHEAILHTGGRMTEGSRSNVFAIRQGELLTPPSGQVLSGITRDIVVRLAREAGYHVAECNLWLADVPRYDEVFITSTSMHVMPVIQIDAVQIGPGYIGTVTADLMRRFADYHRQYLLDRQSV